MKNNVNNYVKNYAKNLKMRDNFSLVRFCFMRQFPVARELEQFPHFFQKMDDVLEVREHFVIFLQHFRNKSGFVWSYQYENLSIEPCLKGAENWKNYRGARPPPMASNTEVKTKPYVLSQE